MYTLLWRSVAMPRCMRRGASQDTLVTTHAEHRRVARARLAARVSRGLVPVFVADVMAHEAVPVRVRVRVPDARRLCAAALVAKQAVTAAAQTLIEARVSLAARCEQHAQARLQRRCRAPEAHAPHLAHGGAVVPG